MYSLSRNFFLFLAQNQLLRNSAKKWGLKLGASKVVAGESITSAMETVGRLNNVGIMGTVDHLGEFITENKEAMEAVQVCLEILDAIQERHLKCHLSLKLTQLGLGVDRNFCQHNLEIVLNKASQHDIFVQIDMEDYRYYQDTLDLLQAFRKKFNNVGTVIQAYLHRASKDVEKLKGVPLRLVKGAYKETPEIAIQDKNSINENFLLLIKQHLRNRSYTAIATHDHYIIDEVKRFVQNENISLDQFEFQMLYGFRTELQKELANQGYRFRTYVPFGSDWYGYFMRRLAERPQNVTFALQGLLSK